MSCSVDDVYKKVKTKPSLAFSVAATPAGVLALLFLILTSMEGVKSLTESESILAIFKESWKGIKSLVAPLANKSVKEAKGAKGLGKKELAVWVITLLVTAGLLIGFATDSLGWLSITLAVLLGAIFIAILSRFASPPWLRAVIGGAIVGAAIGTVVFLIRQVDVWSSKKVYPDVLFVLFLVYFILAGLALWNNYIVPSATQAVLFRKK